MNEDGTNAGSGELALGDAVGAERCGTAHGASPRGVGKSYARPYHLVRAYECVGAQSLGWCGRLVGMNECMLVSVRIGASPGCAGRVGARPKSQQGTYGLCRARWLLIFVVCQVWVAYSSWCGLGWLFSGYCSGGVY